MSATINDGGPAFPVDHKFLRQTASLAEIKIACGMTLRDWFAGQALAGILASANFGNTKDWIGGKAYEAADAMLAARNQGDAK